MEMTDLEHLKSKLANVDERIGRLDGGRDRHLDEVQKYFHLGTVGGSGNKSNLHKLNARRARSIDRSIETAKVYTALARERDELTRRIEYIESGRKERSEKINNIIQERVKNVSPGDVVIDSAYGEVKVIRVNKNSITIEGKSGYREARPFGLIVAVQAK